METLRAYLTPQAEKQRTQQVEEEADAAPDLDIDDDEDDEDKPDWAKQMQRVILAEMRSMLSPVVETVEDLKMNINNIKLETGLARAEAEEAMTQAGLAHGAAEEAANLARDVEKKMNEVQQSMLKLSDVQRMIDEALGQRKHGSLVGHSDKEGASAMPGPSPEKLEQSRRKVVMGGFLQDSTKSVVEEKVRQVMGTATGVDEIYAYRRGSIGFVRFRTADDMWKFLKEFNALQDKPFYNDKKMWAAASRSPEDRRKGKTLSSCKRVLIEVGLAKAVGVDYDSKRGLLWIGSRRVGMWQAEEQQLELDERQMQAAGVAVSAKMLKDAVTDAMGRK